MPGGGGLIAIATSFRLDLGFDTNSFIFLLSHFETARLHPSDSDDGVPTVDSQSFIKQKKKGCREISEASSDFSELSLRKRKITR